MKLQCESVIESSDRRQWVVMQVLREGVTAIPLGGSFHAPATPFPKGSFRVVSESLDPAIGQKMIQIRLGELEAEGLRQPTIKNPMHVAENIAALLESDPIAAAQVKEHLKPERILELLALDARDLRFFAGPDEDDEDEEDDDVRV